MATNKRTITVYPGDDTLDVLGNSSSELNDAMRRYAVVLAHAAARTAETFKPAEWEYLYSALRWNWVATMYTTPDFAHVFAQVIESSIEDHHHVLLGPDVRLAKSDKAHRIAVGDLAQKCRGLSMLEALAVIRALAFRQMHGADSKHGWWSPKYWAAFYKRERAAKDAAKAARKKKKARKR